jgi:hypothetical protein
VFSPISSPVPSVPSRDPSPVTEYRIVAPVIQQAVATFVAPLAVLEAKPVRLSKSPIMTLGQKIDQAAAAASDDDEKSETSTLLGAAMAIVGGNITAALTHARRAGISFGDILWPAQERVDDILGEMEDDKGHFAATGAPMDDITGKKRSAAEALMEDVKRLRQEGGKSFADQLAENRERAKARLQAMMTTGIFALNRKANCEHLFVEYLQMQAGADSDDDDSPEAEEDAGDDDNNDDDIEDDDKSEDISKSAADSDEYEDEGPELEGLEEEATGLYPEVSFVALPSGNDETQGFASIDETTAFQYDKNHPRVTAGQGDLDLDPRAARAFFFVDERHSAKQDERRRRKTTAMYELMDRDVPSAPAGEGIPSTVWTRLLRVLSSKEELDQTEYKYIVVELLPEDYGGQTGVKTVMNAIIQAVRAYYEDHAVGLCSNVREIRFLMMYEDVTDPLILPDMEGSLPFYAVPREIPPETKDFAASTDKKVFQSFVLELDVLGAFQKKMEAIEGRRPAPPPAPFELPAKVAPLPEVPVLPVFAAIPPVAPEPVVKLKPAPRSAFVVMRPDDIPVVAEMQMSEKEHYWRFPMDYPLNLLLQTLGFGFDEPVQVKRGAQNPYALVLVDPSASAASVEERVNAIVTKMHVGVEEHYDIRFVTSTPESETMVQRILDANVVNGIVTHADQHSSRRIDSVIYRTYTLRRWTHTVLFQVSPAGPAEWANLKPVYRPVRPVVTALVLDAHARKQLEAKSNFIEVSAGFGTGDKAVSRSTPTDLGNVDLIIDTDENDYDGAFANAHSRATPTPTFLIAPPLPRMPPAAARGRIVRSLRGFFKSRSSPEGVKVPVRQVTIVAPDDSERRKLVEAFHAQKKTNVLGSLLLPVDMGDINACRLFDICGGATAEGGEVFALTYSLHEAADLDRTQPEPTTLGGAVGAVVGLVTGGVEDILGRAKNQFGQEDDMLGAPADGAPDPEKDLLDAMLASLDNNNSSPK